jgi:hypothetical protein
LIKEIEDLYETSMSRSQRTRAPSGPIESEEAVSLKNKSSFGSLSINESFEDTKVEEVKGKSEKNKTAD